jgi:beta-N-acetylhexosaminidase
MNPNFLDSALTQDIETRLAQMSVEAKVGQLFMIFFTGSEVSPHLKQMIQSYQVGGIILYTIAGNLRNLEQIRELVAQAQALSRIPLLVSIDQEGGSVVRLPAPATHFPSAMMLGATGSPDLAHEMARATAQELLALGINVNFAPVVDVNSNPANPIIGNRAFGSDPVLVSQFGLAALRGYQQSGVIPCAKHFPGHGDTDQDSHLSLPTIHRSLAQLEAIDWIPFRRAIEAGVELIMTAHVRIPALADKPATLSPEIMQACLRDHLGFEGVIITDSLTMGALAQTYSPAQAAVMAFWAGCDILLFGADRGVGPEVQLSAYLHLLELVKQGSIPPERLDQSVRRILRLKARYGLLTSPLSQDLPPSHDLTVDLTVIGSEAHRDLALTIARQGITGNLGTPLPTDDSLLILLPSGVAHLQSLLSQTFPLARLKILDPDSDRLEPGLGAERILVGLWGPKPLQQRLIEHLPAHRCLWLALGSPYDIQLLPANSQTLILYDQSPAVLNLLPQILRGEITPQGHLPIQL